MTYAWSHGWACDVVYLLRTRTAPRQEVTMYVAQCLPAFCVSQCRSKNSVALFSSAGMQQKWAVRIADLLVAQFSNKDTARLEELQQSQHVNHSSCAKLKYTVFSAREKELMALSTRTMFSEYNPTNVHFLIDNYDLIEQTPDDVYNVYFSRHFIEDLLKLEVFININ